ncbi:MAG: hypothetical protein ACPGOV_11790 [Magnetovibrionaceae bacterium]
MTTGLPPILNQIKDAAGEDAALKIARAYGGGWLYVPKSGENTKLHDSLTENELADLAEAFGGERIEIPPAREHVARYLSGLGQNTSQIARELKATRKTIRRYLTPAEADPEGKPPSQHSFFQLLDTS